MKNERKFIKRKTIYLVFFCAFIFLAYEVGIKTSPIHYKQKEVYGIYLSVAYPGYEKTYSSDAWITDKEEIKETLRILNGIRVYRGFYSVDNLSGDSPTALISIYRSENERVSHTGDTYTIYGDIFVTDDSKYYKNVKIGKLCDKFKKDDLEE